MDAGEFGWHSLSIILLSTDSSIKDKDIAMDSLKGFSVILIHNLNLAAHIGTRGVGIFCTNFIV